MILKGSVDSHNNWYGGVTGRANKYGRTEIYGHVIAE